jgi:Dimerisation and cyclophilin-binding domain of Mon2
VQELLKPFLLACESKNAKLASIALVSFQKLLANDAVSEEGVPLIIAGLEQVDLLHNVQPNLT